MRRTLVMIAIALVAIGGIRFAASREEEEESPEKAIYALAHGVEHADSQEVCDRRFPADYVPNDVSRKLGLLGGGLYSTGEWPKYREQCVSELSTSGSYEHIGFEEPRVRDVSIVRVAPAGGVTGAARARVSIEGGPDKTVPLVKFGGNWKIVADAPGS